MSLRFNNLVLFDDDNIMKSLKNKSHILTINRNKILVKSFIFYVWISLNKLRIQSLVSMF